MDEIVELGRATTSGRPTRTCRPSVNRSLSGGHPSDGSGRWPSGRAPVARAHSEDGRISVDLFEYQAKQLFAAVRRAGEPRRGRRHPGRGAGGRRAARRRHRRQGPGQDRRPRQGRRREGRQDARRRRASAEQILGMDIKGHTVHRVLVDPGATSREEYYVSFLLDRANRTFLAMASYEGGMEIEQLAAERPEALAKVPVDAITGVDAAKAREIATAAKFPAELVEPVADVLVRLWASLRRRGRHAGRGQPAGPGRRRHGRRARRQGHPRRQRRLPAAGQRRVRRHSRQPTRWSRRPRRSTSTTSSSTARSASSATAPAWSCPRSTSSPTPARSTAASKPANFLDIGGGAQRRGDGQRAGHHPHDPSVRRVFVNVFGGITVVRRGRQRHRRCAGDARRRGEQAAGRAAGRQQRRRGPADPDRGRAPAGDAGRRRWTRRPTRPPSSHAQRGSSDAYDDAE